MHFPATMSRSTPAPHYLVQSILVTLFCCQPLGIVGIVFAALTMGHNSAGRYDEAMRTSAQAKRWSTWGCVIGLVFIAAYVVLVMVLGIGGAATIP